MTYDGRRTTTAAMVTELKGMLGERFFGMLNPSGLPQDAAHDLDEDVEPGDELDRDQALTLPGR
jgi:hypothetical protein